jgi:hypothetical protein
VSEIDIGYDALVDDAKLILAHVCEVEVLGKVIARVRRDQPHNKDTMLICDALERRLRREGSGSSEG